MGLNVPVMILGALVLAYGVPRIQGLSLVHLTAAYRSLSRPSSADMAKASAVRPYLLDYFFMYHAIHTGCCDEQEFKVR